MSLRYKLTGQTTLHQELIYYVSLETDPDNGWFAVCDNVDESYWHDLADWSPLLKDNTSLPNWQSIGLEIITNNYGMVALQYDNGEIILGPYPATFKNMDEIGTWIRNYLVSD